MLYHDFPRTKDLVYHLYNSVHPTRGEKRKGLSEVTGDTRMSWGDPCDNTEGAQRGLGRYCEGCGKVLGRVAFNGHWAHPRKTLTSLAWLQCIQQIHCVKSTKSSRAGLWCGPSLVKVLRCLSDFKGLLPVVGTQPTQSQNHPQSSGAVPWIQWNSQNCHVNFLAASKSKKSPKKSVWLFVWTHSDWVIVFKCEIRHQFQETFLVTRHRDITALTHGFNAWCFPGKGF